MKENHVKVILQNNKLYIYYVAGINKEILLDILVQRIHIENLQYLFQKTKVSKIHKMFLLILLKNRTQHQSKSNI